MNRRIVSLVLAVLMLLSFAACKAKNPVEETTVPTETVPGVMDVPEGLWEEMVPATQETVAAAEETEATQETSVTEPTNGNSTEETKKPTEPQKPQETQAPQETQDPTTEATEPSTPEYSDTKLSQYEWYHALSGEEQMTYMESFDSVADFFAWYNAAKEEHEKQNPSIEIGNGSVDLGEIVGGKG